MIPKIHQSGASFRGVVAYCLGDKEREKPVDSDNEQNAAHQEWKRYLDEKPAFALGEISDRVEWTETVNIGTDNPRKAARAMAATASYSSELKRMAGIRAGGRKLQKPVCHYTLSWKEGESPKKSTMLKAAEESMQALKMGKHQALLVAHNDGKCAHVHVIVNRVSWEDGRAAKLSNSRLDLSRWAERYERRQNRVQCRRRVEHNRQRSEGKTVIDKESRLGDAIYHRAPKAANFNRFVMPNAKDRISARHVAAFRVVEKRFEAHAKDKLKGMKEDMRSRHRQEWKGLYDQQKTDRERLTGFSQRAVQAVTKEIPVSQEERALGQAVGKALGKQLSKIPINRGEVRSLDEEHLKQRRELAAKHKDEAPRLVQEAQTKFYERPMRIAQKHDWLAEEHGFSYSKAEQSMYKQEMQKQGFPIHGPERRRGQEIDLSR